MIVTLHGFMGGLWSLEGTPHVALRMPFHGVPPAHAECTSWTDALAALEAELPPGPITLLGYSLGARLALGLALRCPRVVAAALVSVHAGLPEAERPARAAFEDAMAAKLETAPLPAFVDEWERLPLFATQSQEQRRVQRAAREANEPAVLAGAFRVLGTSHMPDYERLLGDARVPLLFVAGELDAKYSELATRYAAIRGDSFVVPGVGHNPLVEAPGVTLQRLRTFWEAA